MEKGVNKKQGPCTKEREGGANRHPALVPANKGRVSTACVRVCTSVSTPACVTASACECATRAAGKCVQAVGGIIVGEAAQRV
mmetsp:Transcript_43358/g.90808  ORF Transcript_43358/g.90808 Transcript_43358/m.90808 type:complete len:83 (-) Transcript_43358:241-489(-)